MPETHDLGRSYWHLQRYPDLRDWELPVRLPLFFERGTTNEIEEPFRTGVAWVFRLWPSHLAIVIGWWGKHSGPEVITLQRAHHGRVMDVAVDELADWPGPNREEEPV